MGTGQENKAISFKIYQKVEEILGIDLRSLAAFRIAIGLLILVDLVVRSTALNAHYTDVGVAPRDLVSEFAEQPWMLSLHMLSGGIVLQIVLFVITAISAVCLVLGYRSRVACFICWLLMLSLHVRNPFINNLGDWLLVDLLFWGMFLPLGARYSIDFKKKPTDQELPIRVVSVATMALLLQICLVYFLSVDRKISPVWHTDGTAIEYALNLDRIVSDEGRLLLQLPSSWLQFATFLTLKLERWGPLLAFVPLFLGPVRTAVAFVFVGFHLALLVTFQLGVFPVICIAGWVVFFPSWFWEKTTKMRRFIQDKISKMIDFGRIQEFLIRWPHRKIGIIPGIGNTLFTVLMLFGIISSSMLYSGVMDEVYYNSVYKHIEPFVNSLNLRQRWDMFSPQPPREDGWFVVAAYDVRGSIVNPMDPENTIHWERPASINKTYSNQRWRKYFEWVMDKPDPFAKALGTYVELEYGMKDEPAIVAIYFMREETRTDLRTSSVKRVRLF